MGKQKGDSYKTEFYLPGKIIFFYFAILHKDREEREREKERERERKREREKEKEREKEEKGLRNYDHEESVDGI